MTSIPQATLDTYAATPATITSRSGHMLYVTYSGKAYSVSTIYCTCSDVEAALYRTGRESDDSYQAVLVCPNHGTHTSAALPCGNPTVRGETISPRQAGRIFGYSEQLARSAAKRSKVPQWGFNSNAGSGTNDRESG